MPEITHPKMLAQQHGRKKGSKNKAITAYELTQKFRALCAERNTPEMLYKFFEDMMNNEKIKPSERIKAAKFLMDKQVTDASIDSIIESKTTIDTPEEALAILQGLNAESV